MRVLIFAAALLVTTVGQPGWAQSAAEHEGHHPDQKQEQAKPKAEQPAPAGSQSMDGGGMMGGRMSMMDMAKMMQMMRWSGEGMGMDTIDHIEGPVAFLRTELKITETQQPAWNAFADALRINAKTLGEMRGSTMQGAGGAGLVEKLASQERWLAARLEGTRAMKSALTNLLSTFSDEQKKTADELLAPQMGMVPMMSVMRGGATMGAGMQPGKPMQ